MNYEELVDHYPFLRILSFMPKESVVEMLNSNETLGDMLREKEKRLDEKDNNKLKKRFRVIKGGRA